MFPLLLAAGLLAPASPAPAVEALFGRVAPRPLLVARTPGQTRAVVLIHGLGLALPLQREKATRATLRDWQRPGTPLVSRLGRHADVYSFAFSQTVPVESVAALGQLRAYLGVLRALGYAEIILVGHSAGGLIARHLVEDCPDHGVTRVIQVCAPNRGCPFAGLRLACREQVSFLLSLSLAGRERTCGARADKRLPEDVEFVCVVGSWALWSDGAVAHSSQWPEDLRRQGVPGYAVTTYHSGAMGNDAVIALIDYLVRTPQPRGYRWP